jgi:hypothetical protein
MESPLSTLVSSLGHLWFYADRVWVSHHTLLHLLMITHESVEFTF